MIRRFGRLSDVGNDITTCDSINILFRSKKIIEPHVRVPSWKCKSMPHAQSPIAIDVSVVDHYLNRAVSNPTAEDHRQDPISHRQFLHIQQLARRKRVEITRQNMKAALVFL